MPTKSLGLETSDVGRVKSRLFFFVRAWAVCENFGLVPPCANKYCTTLNRRVY